METTDDQVKALVDRVAEQGVEIAQLRRALLSLGSHLAYGGPPGIKAYLAWHDSQVSPPLEPPAPPEPSATKPAITPVPAPAPGK